MMFISNGIVVKNPTCGELDIHDLRFEAHLARTRFWVPADSELNTYCALRFKCIDHETDHALGI